MQSGRKKPVDIIRLKADVAAAGVEILSAHCAADRIRLQYSTQDVVAFGERATLKKAFASAEAIYRFYSFIDIQLKEVENSNS